MYQRKRIHSASQVWKLDLRKSTQYKNLSFSLVGCKYMIGLSENRILHLPIKCYTENTLEQ